MRREAGALACLVVILALWALAGACGRADGVPLCGRAADDAAALATLRAAFPERSVVGVVCPTVTYGGGGVHCVTQRVIPTL